MLSILYTQAIKAVQSYTFDDWSNKFVIEFRGEEGKGPK